MSSNLPPGVTNRMIDEAAGVGAYCEVCGGIPDDGTCVCEECPVCGEIGNAVCYREHATNHGSDEPCSPQCHGINHGLLNQKQLISRERLAIQRLKLQLQECEMYLAWLGENPQVKFEIDDME